LPLGTDLKTNQVLEHYRTLMFAFLLLLVRFAYPGPATFPGLLEMRASATDILDRAENELEQIFERMRRHCESALGIFRHINLDELSPENREHICDRIHTLREMARILSPDFEKKLMIETDKLGRALSRDEAQTLLYGLDEF
jgi:hypothetical protein